MVKKFTVPQFKKWERAYLENMNIPFTTKSALIELVELEKFIANIKKLKADSVRICFMRFEIGRDEPQGKKFAKNGEVLEGCKWVESANGLTQAAIALVPTKKFRANSKLINKADNIVDGNKILVLMPGGEKEGPTGHNPPPSTKESATTAQP